MDLLKKILKSNRLFTYNEFSVYHTLSYWPFMQLKPNLQLMPSHSTVLSYFNSLPNSSSFVERDDGQIYSPMFSAVHLHGILYTGNIQGMQLMNILPRETLIDLLSQHYHSDPLYHSEILSLHGFHFELKGVGSRDGIYSFYM